MKHNRRCYPIRWYYFDLLTILVIVYGTQTLQNSKLENLAKKRELSLLLI